MDLPGAHRFLKSMVGGMSIHLLLDKLQSLINGQCCFSLVLLHESWPDELVYRGVIGEESKLLR